MNLRRRILLVLVIVCACVGCDQATKRVADVAIAAGVVAFLVASRRVRTEGVGG